MVQFTRAQAASEDVLAVIATLDDAEIYDADARAFQYRHRADFGEKWYYEDFQLSIQDITYFTASTPPQSYFAMLSAEGDVYHFAEPARYQERIRGAGTSAPDSKFYGKMLKMSQVGARLYACGAGGQIYFRADRDDWRMLTDAVLNDPEAQRRHLEGGPPIGDPRWQEWIIQKARTPVSRNIVFYDIRGFDEDHIYFCGVENQKPILCFWDGKTLEELKLPIEKAALTGIYVESSESVWVCGREGTLLHGSRNRGFAPVNIPTRLNLFHHITPYKDNLVLPSSVRPGGLYQLDPITQEFGRFTPSLPRLRQGDGPFFAQAVGDILWVVALKDIFRFDGVAWERIEHPDM